MLRLVRPSTQCPRYPYYTPKPGQETTGAEVERHLFCVVDPTGLYFLSFAFSSMISSHVTVPAICVINRQFSKVSEKHRNQALKQLEIISYKKSAIVTTLAA